MQIHLNEKTEVKLQAYREKRRRETGKVMQRHTAVVEIIEQALNGIDPPKPIDDRLSEIEGRLSALENLAGILDLD